MKRIYFVRLFVTLSCFALAGCHSIPPDWKKHIPWSAEARLKKSDFETPTHMVAVWTPDILTQTGKPPTRGVGGRLYFYNDKNQAVPVEGQLIVYGYDESQPTHPQGDPDRKYAFTPEQFNSHYSATDLGASYSIWIPWDPSGGDQKSISLVPVFTATSGQIVMGQQARNVLPGKKSVQYSDTQPASALLPLANVQPVAQAVDLSRISEQFPANNGAVTSQAQVATIQLPRSMQL